MDNDVKVYGVLGPICESHQPGTTKKFVESYGKFEFFFKSKGFCIKHFIFRSSKLRRCLFKDSRSIISGWHRWFFAGDHELLG